jgi:hypothetical protein
MSTDDFFLSHSATRRAVPVDDAAPAASRWSGSRPEWSEWTEWAAAASALRGPAATCADGWWPWTCVIVRDHERIGMSVSMRVCIGAFGSVWVLGVTAGEDPESCSVCAMDE